MGRKFPGNSRGWFASGHWTDARFARTIKRITLPLTLAVILIGCAIGAPRDSVLASAYSANYTEDYIPEFHIETSDGGDTGAQGIQVRPFSQGGAGKTQCCSYLPVVGKTIRVIWSVGAYNDPESKRTTFSKDIRTLGSVSSDANSFTYLIVRFFPDHEVEAEYVSQLLSKGSPLNPRVDLLFTGQRVMRHIGE
ncbi:DUF3304 domain-containing protein [Paraburkholderia diazotrophica]|uniref:DUF3304 domain-containing protein n=1 Tax=Paraburkholderia diazotrophica TaxID=667676 RepID=UPI00316D0CB6